MKKYALLGIIFLLIIGLTIGCTPARRVEPEDNRNINDPQNNMLPNNQNNLNDPNNPNNVAPRNNNTPGLNNADNNNNDETRSREIADIASDVKGVDNATVVITGETAYVGIDIDKDMENEETDRVKEKVGDAIKKDAEGIERVYVSADVDSVQRLRDIGRDVRGGRPISGFLDELTEMFRRPVPSAE
jgi:YhcN/YlaJ family sporulation lipoprotein